MDNYLTNPLPVRKTAGSPGASETYPTIISGFAVFKEFGSLRHPAAHSSSCISSHTIAAPAATLMVPSIKKPSKCAIYSFSFSYLFLLYTLPGSWSQEPGQYFSQISYLLFRTLLGNYRARAGEQILKYLSNKSRFLAILGSFGVWSTLIRRAARPATLSTGYPQLKGYR